MILSYRGKPVMRLEPIIESGAIDDEDPFYQLAELAVEEGSSLSNSEMDALIYGK